MKTSVGTAPATAAETAAHGVAHRRLHLPASVTFTADDEPPAYRERLEALLLRAVVQAIEKDDQRAGIAAPRQGWSAAGASTASGAPAAPAQVGRSHLDFAMAMAVAETDDGGEGAGHGEEEGEKHEETRGGGGTAGADGPHASGGDGTEPASAPDAPAPGTGHTPGTPATPATGATATTDTTPAPEATPDPSTRAVATTDVTTVPTAAEAEAQAEARAPGPALAAWVASEEAAAAEPELERAREAAKVSAGRKPGVTVVSDPHTEVVEGPSPVDGRAVMVIGATRLVLLGEATRYARSRSLLHATQLGDHLFGARSYAVLEGGAGTAESHYLAVATTPAVDDETIGEAVRHWKLEDEEVTGFTGFSVLPVVTTPDGHRYYVNMLWTKERVGLWGSEAAAREWIRTRKLEYAFWLSAEELKILAFQELDRLVDAGLAGDEASLEKAATQLADMNAKTFALVDEETRAKYLEILVKAWTFEEQRHAIIQIMISLDDLAQLQAVRARLVQAGLYTQLFADMGSDLWDLLTAVGQKFGDKKDVTVREFIGFVAEALHLSMRREAGTGQDAERERTALPGLRTAIEIEEAVRAVMGFVLGTLESLKVMLTQPEKVLSGLWELQKLATMCYAALFGDPVSTRQLKSLVAKIGPVLVAGLRGAELFGVGDRLLTRIKWAVIIEALTWISEIQAAVEALVKIQKVVAVLRFLKVLKVFEGERIAARFTRLAEALHAGSAVLKGLKDEHAVAELMTLLPEEDGARLGRVLQEVEVPKGSSLASLREHPQLGPVLADLQPRAEALRVLGAKSGGLTPEVAQTFARLTGKDAFTTAEVAKVVGALQEGEGARFAKTLEQIGFDRIGSQAQVKADLLAMLAGDRRRMDAVRQYGITVVGQMHARSAGSAEAFDLMLARLEKIRAKHLADGKAVEFAELVDKLNQGKKGAWRRLDRPVKPPRVKATAAEQAPVLRRIKELRERFPKNEVKNQKAMKNALRQLARMAETDPAKAMEHLEKFEDLLRAQGTTEGQVAEIVAEAEGKAGREARALHHEPDEAPAQSLSARDELRSRTGEAGSPSKELRRNMEGIGQYAGPGEAAHHATAATDRRAEPLRDILEWAGVDARDDPLNGVYLPETSMDPNVIPQAGTRHQVLHTDNYYKEMTRRLVEARKHHGPDGVIHEMSRIKEELLHGAHWPRVPGEPHESYADWFAKYRHNLEWLTDAEQLELLERVRAGPRRKKAPRARGKAAAREGAGAETVPKSRPPETAKAKPEARPKAEVKPEPEVKPKAEVEPKAKTESQAQVKGEGGKAEVQAQAKEKAKEKAKAKAKAKAKEKAQAQAQAKAKEKAKAEAKAKTKTKTKTKAEATAKARVKAEAKAQAEAKAKAAPHTEADPVPPTATEPEPRLRIATEPGPAPAPPPEPAVRSRIATQPEPEPPPAAGPRISLDPKPRKRRGRKPRLRVEPPPHPTRVALEAVEDVRGEPLYDVAEEETKPARKKKRAHEPGGHGR
ncbi:AHH domain-containing protein [Streptomyces hydrogenans]|uniref:AHH domain-containing protein n=1 Tax=Streptomyces hydrogenans TaxID=1873719 RepID=UPI003424B8E7